MYFFFSTGAVRKNHSSTNAADNEIDSYAIRWFNLASDRGGGRKERARAKEALTEVKSDSRSIVAVTITFFHQHNITVSNSG